MRQAFIIVLLLFFSHFMGYSQQHRVYGKVVDRQLQPLYLASVEIKDSKIGTITKEDGSFEFKLDRGNYGIIVSMVGYKSKVLHILADKDIEQNFILLEDEGPELGEVVIKAKARDRAEELIRSVIKQKESIKDATGSYSCDVYIKAVQEDSVFRKNKVVADTAGPVPPHADFDKMAIAELLLQVDYGTGQQFKQETIGYSTRNETGYLYYLSPSEGNFNLYNNLIKVPTVSPIPFISPVSYSGLVAYRFKTIRIETQGTHKVYTISIKPRLLSNATVEGEITIDDSSKTILKSTFNLPSFHMAEYDFFEVKQEYDYVNNTAWLITKQTFTYYSKKGKGRRSGHTVAVYKNFSLNKTFKKGHFGNEVIVATQQAFERDSSFWKQTRTEPLTAKEIRFIEYKDSIYTLTRSEKYLDSIDAVNNKVTWKNALIFGQVFTNHKKQTKWILPPVTSLFQPFQFGGSRLNVAFIYNKTFPSRRNISLITNASYGFRNKDVNGSVSFRKMYNPFSRGSYSISAGRDFQFIFDGDAWINMLQRSNIYLNNSFGVGHSLEIVNGLMLFNEVDIALRRSVSHYKVNSKVDSLFGNILTDNQAVPFEPYNAVYNKIKLQYTPRQKYIRDPKEKHILGSKLPTFFVEWQKGVKNLFSSEIDFDYLEFGIEQKPKFGILGNGAYKIKTGSFLNKRDLRLVDYKFQRRGDPLFFLDPDKAFQSLDSTFPVFERFYEGHYAHEFNGYFLNKIPFLKKLQLREVAGAGFLIAPERDLRYFEMFAGVERVMKLPFNQLSKFKLGIYIVGSVANKFNSPVQIKIGLKKWDWRRNKWL